MLETCRSFASTVLIDFKNQFSIHILQCMFLQFYSRISIQLFYKVRRPTYFILICGK